MSVKFGIITDPHHTDRLNTHWPIIWDGEWRLYEDALTRISRALDWFYAQGIKLVLVPGDLIDSVLVAKTANTLLEEFVVILNNHDYVTNGGRVLVCYGNHDLCNWGPALAGSYADFSTRMLAGDAHLDCDNYYPSEAEFTSFSTVWNNVMFVGYSTGLNASIVADIASSNYPVVYFQHIEPTPVARIDDPMLQLVIYGHDHRGVAAKINAGNTWEFTMRGSIRASEPQNDSDTEPASDVTHGSAAIVELFPNAYVGTSGKRMANFSITMYDQGQELTRSMESFLVV